jgi:hypothetical protein
MPNHLPPHPNVRNCTHIKVAGQQCGSPALRGEHFCYFHTRVIKGVQQRVDMQLHPIALLEDHESIQLSLMHVVDGLWKGTLEPIRARLIIQALRIAARNAVHARFDDCYYEEDEQKMVRVVPDYARQYLIEHPEYGPPLSPCGAGAPAREANRQASTGFGKNTSLEGHSFSRADKSAKENGALAPEAHTYFFGLPGNPVSTMVTFELFARPILEALVGMTPRKLIFLHAKLKSEIKTKPGLKRFLPAILSGEFEQAEVELVPWQGSGDIAATAAANCYIVIPPDRERIAAGEWMPLLMR